MKLYLSSYHLGDRPEQLTNLVKNNNRFGIVTNAVDFSTDYERVKQFIQKEHDDLKNLDIIPEALDLREYFGKQSELNQKVLELGGLWITGGNTFILRRAMQQSGLDEIILSLKSSDFVYSGYSAGVCVITPTLRGLEIVDEPFTVPDKYSSEVIWEGLGLIDYSVAPHYQSDHPESERIDKTVAYFVEHQMPYKTLRDGEAIVTEI